MKITSIFSMERPNALLRPFNVLLPHYVLTSFPLYRGGHKEGRKRPPTTSHFKTACMAPPQMPTPDELAPHLAKLLPGGVPLVAVEWSDHVTVGVFTAQERAAR
jgi:hypothetical protein